MANGNDLGFWATLSGLIGVLIGPPLALIKSTSLSKKDLEKNNADRDKGRELCRDELHGTLKEIMETQTKQTAWIMTIAHTLKIDKAREL